MRKLNLRADCSVNSWLSGDNDSLLSSGGPKIAAFGKFKPRCRCGRAIRNNDDDLRAIQSMKSDGSMSTVSDTDSVEEGMYIVKKGRLCADCQDEEDEQNEQDDDDTSSQNSATNVTYDEEDASLWPPNMITVSPRKTLHEGFEEEERDLPPPPPLSTRSSMMKHHSSPLSYNGGGIYQEDQKSKDIIESHTKDSIETPLAVNTTASKAESTKQEEKPPRLPHQPKSRDPRNEGMSEGLLANSTDDSGDSHGPSIKLLVTLGIDHAHSGIIFINTDDSESNGASSDVSESSSDSDDSEDSDAARRALSVPSDEISRTASFKTKRAMRIAEEGLLEIKKRMGIPICSKDTKLQLGPSEEGENDENEPPRIRMMIDFAEKDCETKCKGQKTAVCLEEQVSSFDNTDIDYTPSNIESALSSAADEFFGSLQGSLSEAGYDDIEGARSPSDATRKFFGFGPAPAFFVAPNSPSKKAKRAVKEGQSQLREDLKAISSSATSNAATKKPLRGALRNKQHRRKVSTSFSDDEDSDESSDNEGADSVKAVKSPRSSQSHSVAKENPSKSRSSDSNLENESRDDNVTSSRSSKDKNLKPVGKYSKTQKVARAIPGQVFPTNPTESSHSASQNEQTNLMEPESVEENRWLRLLLNPCSCLFMPKSSSTLNLTDQRRDY